MLHGAGKEAIWGDFSVRMGVLLCEEYRGRQRRKEWLWERLFYRDTMWGSLFWLAFYFALLLNNYMFNISYIITILYICKQKEITMTKVIHVQLMKGRKNYYFGSIPAIYSVLTAEDIGIKQSSLERVGLSKGGVVLNKKACIRAGELIRSKVTK